MEIGKVEEGPGEIEEVVSFKHSSWGVQLLGGGLSLENMGGKFDPAERVWQTRTLAAGIGLGGKKLGTVSGIRKKKMCL